MIVFIIPKNSGLKCKAEEIVKEYKYEKLVEVRGEDVPLVVKRLIDRNKNVIGITGEDLFKEFLSHRIYLINSAVYLNLKG